MRLYTKSNISELDIDNGKIKYLKEIVENGISSYVQNCHAEVVIMEYSNIYFPLIICKNLVNQTYLTSLISSYIDYPLEIIQRQSQNFFTQITESFLQICKKFLFFTEIDNAIYINNWLVSTNVYDENWSLNIKEIGEYLKKKYPDKAIIYRNISIKTNNDLYQALKKQQYKFLINRKSYIIDDFKKAYKKQSLKKDISFSKKSNYKMSEEFSSEKFAQLYSKLYIEKYTKLNPDYNQKYFELIKNASLGESFSLAQNGNIYGFLSTFNHKNWVICPFFGYDTSQKSSEGLYRILILELIKYAKNKNLKLNLSSGVEEYKTRRGAEPYWEYLAIDYSHLNLKKKIGYFLLINFTNKISYYLAQMMNLKFF